MTDRQTDRQTHIGTYKVCFADKKCTVMNNSECCRQEKESWDVREPVIASSMEMSKNFVRLVDIENV